ncbi:YitT family protein [Psychrosphaera ytuae]|uniref:YitT family protein n=1 Tax=Psychrosphaera ytuae TaxID=2820710 RepID=A0A975DA16_9GAMM|nr:YitT family protein [Psychrosphaera ytuae]QTH63306.1 YitT family protein [Psychrosphaera ytuae]
MKKIAFQWYAILEGCFLVALGIFFLQSSELLVGGTAGVSALLNRHFELTFGTWFFIVNLPFFYLAIKQMGRTFTVRSFFCIGLVSLLSDALTLLIVLDTIPTWLAAFIGGGLIGIGLLLLFRHNTSLGGVNILALYLEKRFNIHSGKVILALDCVVLAAALHSYPIEKVAYSLVGFIVLSSVLGRYHKKAPVEQHSPQPERGRSKFSRLKWSFKKS